MKFTVALVLLSSAFWQVLVELLSASRRDDLFSHIPFVPVVSLILARRSQEAMGTRQASPLLAAIVGGLGIFLLAAAWWWGKSAGNASPLDVLSLQTAALLCAVLAAGLGFLGREAVRQAGFAWAFLLFMIPLPPGPEDWLAGFLQHGSAIAAGWFFELSGIPFRKEDLLFHLPGITLRVAPECSGIRSTLILFMTSLVAGQIMLERKWQRLLLAALVIPLGIARNAFRIAFLGWLCVRYGPEMIHSAIHRQGGPVFFALSILPLVGIVLLLRRRSVHYFKSTRRSRSSDVR